MEIKDIAEKKRNKVCAPSWEMYTSSSKQVIQQCQQKPQML